MKCMERKLRKYFYIHRPLLLSLPRESHLLRNIPADDSCLCDKSVTLRDTMKEKPWLQRVAYEENDHFLCHAMNEDCKAIGAEIQRQFSHHTQQKCSQLLSTYTEINVTEFKYDCIYSCVRSLQASTCRFVRCRIEIASRISMKCGIENLRWKISDEFLVRDGPN
jgi:hypothetical protein